MLANLTNVTVARAQGAPSVWTPPREFPENNKKKKIQGHADQQLAASSSSSPKGCDRNPRALEEAGREGESASLGREAYLESTTTHPPLTH